MDYIGMNTLFKALFCDLQLQLRLTNLLGKDKDLGQGPRNALS